MKHFTKYPKQTVMAASTPDISQFDENQQIVIHDGLQHGYDVSWYADPKYNFRQMQEIEDGLSWDIDVSQYADPRYSWEEMRDIRNKLIDAKYEDDDDDYDEANYEDYIQYVVYELDPENDYEELNSIQTFSSLADAKKFAQSCDFPTHIVFVPTMDPDDDPDFAEWLEENFEIEPYEEVWRS